MLDRVGDFTELEPITDQLIQYGCNYCGKITTSVHGEPYWCDGCQDVQDYLNQNKRGS
jgi:hypothetical protein